MDIDGISKLIQAGFYIVVGAIAVLTYLKAKKGLLNTINAEYQKKALVKVEEISDYLISEFDENSENHWSKQDVLSKCINAMFDDYKEYTSIIEDQKKWVTGIPDNPTARRLSNWLEKVKSDPFVPKTIREIVTEHLEERVNKILSIHLQELRAFGDELAVVPEKYLESDRKHVIAVVSNKINEQNYESGCGISQVQDQVHALRLEIQKYYERYDPFL